MQNLNTISGMVVDSAFQIHRALGPGLLESVYEIILAKELEKRGLNVECQRPVPVEYDGTRFELGFVADLVIEGVIVVELKSLEQLAPVHSKQLLTYLKLMNLQLGLLINFGAPTIKQGLRRVVNNFDD